MAAALPMLSLLFIYLYVLLTICPGVFLDALPLFCVCVCVCMHLFFVCWRCRLLQYVVFLLHLSQDHKCVLAVWSLGVTCIRFVTHSSRLLSQLIVNVPSFSCTRTDGLHVFDTVFCFFVLVPFFFTFTLTCDPFLCRVSVCELLESGRVFVVYGL